ncbi:hypothetical protein GPALN_006024 [Globodera pallida]|nr:hypothetical protein GPALN_006024 [Globodera pallida]
MENSDALRKASGRILRAILENTNFFPRKRHRSHADFTHALRQLLLPSPSDLWYNKTLEAYSQFIENPARDGIGIWAQLDDAHTIAILLQRPVVILRPIAENDILREERPKWNNKSITQRIDVRFPDGEYMGMTRNIPHVQLNSFTVQERTLEYVLVERTVVNPIVIWYDGIDHYQSIIFDPMAPNASAGSEYIFAQNFDIPEDFLHGNKAPQQQHPPDHDYARKRGQESKKRSHPESIEKGTEKAGTQLEIQNFTSDQFRKINVVSGDITKQKVSVIVTDANGQLRHGGGINDAIHRACEPEMGMLQLVLNTLIMSKRSAYPPGSVVVTDAFGNLRKNVQYLAAVAALEAILNWLNTGQTSNCAITAINTENVSDQRAVHKPITAPGTTTTSSN